GWMISCVTAACLTLVAIECGARIIFHDKGGEPNSMLLDRWAAFRMSENFDRPGMHHNAQGVRRDRDVSLTKPPSTVRIFVVGASVAYGADGVYQEIDDRWSPTNRETIDFYLEQRLSQAFPAKRWEVINAGVKGYLLHQDLMRLLSSLLAY